MIRRSRMPLALSSLLVAATLGGDLGCATEEQDAVHDDNAATGPTLKGLAGNAAGGHAATNAGTGTTEKAGGAPTTAGSASGGATNGGERDASGGGGHATAGHAAGSGEGGSAGTASGGTGGGSNGGNAGSAGQAGGPNQPAMCDEATATVLGSMSSNVTVASNVCLKMTLPADQTWIKKITLQPEGGMYPLPFTWSNCGTNSSGAFTANYANSVLNPVTPQCPILVKLGGNGSPVNVQWWGG